MPEPETNKTADAIISEKPDTHALLAAANSASERVSGLHVAFMAICVYVLVIVFGTTDLDLLMGKGVRLPIVNVDVPIVGFYAFAPYLVVLVHFNLLLQLQLLSRKLFAFDAAAPQQENIGGLRDQLHIFPYTYYLVGRPSALVRALVGLMVSITVVLLPIATLLALQLRFLSYQSEVVTWWQRVATWLDLAVIVTLWPIILDSQDDWRRYWRDLITAHVPRRRVWVVFALLLAGLVLLLFSGGNKLTAIGYLLLLLTPFITIPLYGRKNMPRAHILYLALLGTAAVAFMLAGVLRDSTIRSLLGPLLFIPLSLLWHPQAPRGSLALLMTFFIGLLVPLALLVDGEGLERLVLRNQSSQSSTTRFSNYFLRDNRRLDLREQILMAKPPKPETLALIRSGNWQEALKQIEPINFQGRSLRHADMSKAILISGDLRNADLQGADLIYAQLQGADLSGAKLHGANLSEAQLQGADLSNTELRGAKLQDAQLQGANLERAQLQGANMERAQLQGVNLEAAQLQGATMERAQLQGAHLWKAQLRGANLKSAQLQGAGLWVAQLQGANLWGAQLQGADLEGAQLQYASLGFANFQGAILESVRLNGVFVSQLLGARFVDARWVSWGPLTDKEVSEIVSAFEEGTMDTDKRREFSEKKDSTPQNAIRLHFESCLAQAETPLVCERRFDPKRLGELHDFTGQLHTYLGKLACESPEISRGILRQIPGWIPKRERKITGKSKSFTRKGLEVELKRLLNDKKCTGLQNLIVEEKDQLRAMK